MEIPIEFLRQFEKVKRDRLFASQMIDHYTKEWVKHQQRYIEMLDFIEGRTK